MGRPEEIAHAAVYFASEGSAWMTGSILSVDGGDGTVTVTPSRSLGAGKRAYVAQPALRGRGVRRCSAYGATD
jgi:hypothetical protein